MKVELYFSLFIKVSFFVQNGLLCFSSSFFFMKVFFLVFQVFFFMQNAYSNQ